MIINQQKNTVTTNVKAEAGKFDFNKTAEAYKALSMNLYKDTIASIVREITCNALDAHTAAGLDRPIDVTMPTEMSDVFEVRDYGNGIRDEDFASVYTVYFGSSKRDSNDAIGGWGLGAKTPLAEVDQYTVTSIVRENDQNIKRVYQIFFNENDEPSFLNVHTEITDEHTGLTVSVPTKEKDRYRYKSAAERYFQYYKIKPNVNLDLRFDNANRDKLVHNDQYTLYNSGDGARAIVGGVVYHLSNIDDLIKSPAIDWRVDMYFDIGDLQISLSRETLTYDEKTVKTIEERLAVVSGELFGRVEQEISKAKTLRDAMSVRSEWSRYIGKKEFKHNGVVVPSGSIHVNNAYNMRSVQYGRKLSTPTEFYYDYYTRFIYDDTSGKNVNSVIARFKSDHTPRGNVYLIPTHSEKFKNQVESKGWEVRLVSQMPKRVSSPRSNETQFEMEMITDGRLPVTVDETVLTKDDIYIFGSANFIRFPSPLSDGTFDSTPVKRDNGADVSLIQFLNFAGLSNRKLYIVRSSISKKKIKDATYFGDVVEEVAKTSKFASAMMNSDSFETKIVKRAKSLDSFFPDHFLTNSVKKFVHPVFSRDMRVNLRLSRYKINENAENELHSTIKTLTQKYPLITDDIKLENLKSYVMMVDEIEELKKKQAQ